MVSINIPCQCEKRKNIAFHKQLLVIIIAMSSRNSCWIFSTWNKPLSISQQFSRELFWIFSHELVFNYCCSSTHESQRRDSSLIQLSLVTSVNSFNREYSRMSPPTSPILWSVFNLKLFLLMPRVVGNEIFMRNTNWNIHKIKSLTFKIKRFGFTYLGFCRSPVMWWLVSAAKETFPTLSLYYPSLLMIMMSSLNFLHH